MRILMTTDTVGGVWNYALELARALQPYGVQISLATMGGRLSPDQHLEVSQLRNVELFESDYRLEWMDAPWKDVAAARRWLKNLAKDVVPDVVHLNDFAHGAEAWNAPCLVVGHSCVLSWHQCVRGRAAGPDWKIYRTIVKRGLAGADLVVAPSRAMLGMLDYFHGPLPRKRAILNGRRKLPGKPSPKEPFVLSAGRLWDEAKNIGALAAAAPRLAWPVRLAGLPHPEADKIPMPTTGPITFLGRLTSSEMARQYHLASIYALPARYEPFGLTPLEAGLGRCALVLGDIRTLREVWGDAALFVPPDDRAGLAETLNRLIADRELRGVYATRAYQRACQLNERRMAAGYMKAYRELLADFGRSEHQRILLGRVANPGRAANHPPT